LIPKEINIVLQCHSFAIIILLLVILLVCYNHFFLVTLQVVRTSLMSCLLKTLKHNIDHPRPIKVLFWKEAIFIFSI
jgi:hypothetical protein